MIGNFEDTAIGNVRKNKKENEKIYTIFTDVQNIFTCSWVAAMNPIQAIKTFCTAYPNGVDNRLAYVFTAIAEEKNNVGLKF